VTSFNRLLVIFSKSYQKHKSDKTKSVTIRKVTTVGCGIVKNWL
jgi:hypothetical protein